MSEVKIKPTVWRAFADLARRLDRDPKDLAARLVNDYLQCINDLLLDEDSRQDARRSQFTIQQAEEFIRQYRRRLRATNGHPKEAHARRA